MKKENIQKERTDVIDEVSQKDAVKAYADKFDCFIEETKIIDLQKEFNLKTMVIKLFSFVNV